MGLRKSAVTFIIAAASLILVGCATEPSLYTGQTGYYGYTWEQEQKLGQQSDASIVREMGVYPNDELGGYIRDMGERLLTHSAIRSSDAPELYRNTDFTFRLLDSPVVNAFALPGGYVYVTRGLLAHLENEAQLAVVIGHEITHVEARHASKQALTRQIGQIGLLAGAVIGEQVAENKQLAREMVNLGGNLFQLGLLKYGRDAERESDQYGVKYAALAGYDAAEGAAFFRSLDRLSDKSGQSLPSWMSTHPDPGERERSIPQIAEQWTTQAGASPTVGRERFLRKIDGLIVGENPRNGYSEGTRFYHPDLRIQFDRPQGWLLQNESGAVYIIDPAKTTQVVFTLAQESSPLEAARNLQEKLSLETTYAQDSSVNGLPAYVVEGNVATESGTLSLHATFVKFGSNVFTILGYGSSAAFPANLRSVRGIAGSFAELTNPQALNVQPYRISVEGAARSAPFQELLPSRLPPGTDAQDWAIMNQIELDTPIERGRLIKLPSERRN